MAELQQPGYPRIADVTDLPRLISGDNVRFQWPPPGTTVMRYGFPEAWVLVYGDPSEGDADTWWVTNLGQIAGYWPELELLLLRYAAAAALRLPVLAWAGSLAQYPVIYQPSGGKFMRWIRATMRGTLGGTAEQFQHKFDFGVPGADPTLAEADAPALAEQLAGYWSTALTNAQSTTLTAKSRLATGVVYTEVGVAQFHQDNAGTNTDPAGDRVQDYPAGWFGWAIGARPTGSSGNSVPYEVACAITFQTDKRGPRGRGRIYLPPLGTGELGATGLFAVNSVKTLAEAVGDFFDAVKLGTPYLPIVVSSRAKELNEITSINAGTVPDSQRRRRRSLDEARVTYWTA